MMMIYWKKSEVISFSENFLSTEFACQCSYPSCIEQIFDHTLVVYLQLIRYKLGIPVKITSGYRCAAHQEDLRKSNPDATKQRSQHELGKAADISCRGPHLFELYETAKFIFSTIGDGRHVGRYVHVDLRRDKVRHWEYGEKD